MVSFSYCLFELSVIGGQRKRAKEILTVKIRHDLLDPLANDEGAKKVKDWRHSLQRAFLSKGELPDANVGTRHPPRQSSV